MERTPEVPPTNCRWPYSDAALHCGPQMQITLLQLPETLAHSGAVRGAGGWLTQTLGQMGSNPLAAALAAPVRPLRIEISLPQLAYGSTGVKVPHALLRVSGGGWPDAVSRGPADVEPGTGVYFPATGRVSIDAYDALELRGSFKADLVEDPVPTSTRGDRPTLPVLGRIAGRFSIGQPWRGDEAYVAQAPSTDEVDFDMQERLPGPGQADAGDDASTPEADRERRAPPSPADGRTPATAGSPAPAGCDCSCAGYRRLLQLMDAINTDPQRYVFSHPQERDGPRPRSCVAPAMKVGFC